MDLFAGDISPLNFRVISWRSFFFCEKEREPFQSGKAFVKGEW